jgi:hypothetical protein
LYYGLQVSKICINKIIHVSQIFKYEYWFSSNWWYILRN